MGSESSGEYELLIVDDDPDLLESIRLSMKFAGFGVKTAQTAEECVEKIREEPPDALIIDILLPGMSGFELVRSIREDPLTSEIPVVFLTCLSDEPTVVRALKEGDDYLAKPFRMMELEERVRKAIERSRAGLPRGRLPGNKIPVRTGNDLRMVSLHDVYRAEASGKYSYLCLINGNRVLSGYSLSELEKLLPKDDFLRVHKSHVINLHYLQSLKRQGEKFVAAVGQGERVDLIPVGRAYFTSLKRLLYA